MKPKPNPSTVKCLDGGNNPKNTKIVELSALLAQRELARRKFINYVMLQYDGYEAGWVQRDICDRLERFYQDVQDRKSPRLMLNCPPRLGKSLLASTLFPAWAMGKNPKTTIISTSYNLDLPLSFSRKVRGYVRDDEVYHAVFPNTHLSTDSQSAETWETTDGGVFVAAGIGGGLTGKGCNCVIPYAEILQLTASGSILPTQIKDIKVGDVVYATDKHRNIVSTTVRAVSATFGKRADVTTGGIRTTGDHKFATGATAWTEADRLEQHHELVAFNTDLSRVRLTVREANGRHRETVESGAEDAVLLSGVRLTTADKGEGGQPADEMPILRWGKSAARYCMQKLFRGYGGRSPPSVDLRSLRDDVHAVTGGGRQSEPAWGGWDVLLEVLRDKSTTRGSRDGNDRMPSLWDTVHSNERPQDFLFKKLLRAAQALKHLRILPDMAFNKAICGGAGQPDLSVVRGEVTPDGCPSYRRGAHKPHPEQPDNCMPAMPQMVSWQHGTCAKDLASAYGADSDEEWVVDIQTGEGNFLARSPTTGLFVLLHNCLIIDDNIKNSEEADNQALHDKQYEWYQSTAYTRLAPGGGIIIIATRWSFGDLSGRLQALSETDPDADRFEVVSYPAIAETFEYRHRVTHRMSYLDQPCNDPDMELLREPGQVLHPERFTPKMVAAIKSNLSPRIWSALYQQKPVPDEGIFFRKDYIRFLPDIPYFAQANVYTTWDFAISTKNSADYTSHATLMQDTSALVVVANIARFKRDTYGIVEEIIDQAVYYQREYPNFSYMAGFEDGQIFKALLPVLKRRMQERQVFFSYEVLPPLTDKMVRARPLQSLMQQGNVYFVETIPALSEALSELLQFPASRNDDMVDALSWGARMVLKFNAPRPAESTESRQKHTSWKDVLGKLLPNALANSSFMGD